MTTPGIWEAVQWGCKAKTAVVVNDESVLSGKRVIADFGTEDDARLIAASKEMLEELKVALACAEVGLVPESHTLDKFRDAIANAEGKKP